MLSQIVSVGHVLGIDEGDLLTAGKIGNQLGGSIIDIFVPGAGKALSGLVQSQGFDRADKKKAEEKAKQEKAKSDAKALEDAFKKRQAETGKQAAMRLRPEEMKALKAKIQALPPEARAKLTSSADSPLMKKFDKKEEKPDNKPNRRWLAPALAIGGLGIVATIIGFVRR